jgi:hypothetical protein
MRLAFCKPPWARMDIFIASILDSLQDNVVFERTLLKFRNDGLLICGQNSLRRPIRLAEA